MGAETHHVLDLGLQPVGFDGDDYVVELSIEPRHLNVGGIVHGGVICSLLDTAMARSWFMREGNDLFVVTQFESWPDTRRMSIDTRWFWTTSSYAAWNVWTRRTGKSGSAPAASAT